MCQCCPHIETSELICCADQLTGFYMRATLALNRLNSLNETQTHYKTIWNSIQSCIQNPAKLPSI